MTERKNQILEEATRLFSADGYDGMTMKQLAAACGITEPALYRHFQSKESLYDAVLDAVAQRLDTERFIRTFDPAADLESILVGLSEHIIDFYTRHADIYRLLLYSALGGHAKAKQVFAIIRGSYIKFLVRHLDRLQAEGKIVAKSNDITARCFIGMVFDCAMSKTLWRGFHGKSYKPNEIIANNVPIYIRGLTPCETEKPAGA